MFRIILVTCIALTATALVVQAADPYIGLAVNYSQLEDADDGGVAVEGAFGLGIGKALRAEAALGYDTAEVGNLDVDLWSLFANLYYDFNMDGRFTPYVVGGLGYSTVKVEDFSSEGSFAGQLGAGVGFNLLESLVIDLRYRYIMSEEYLNSFNFNAHQVGLGLRYHF